MGITEKIEPEAAQGHAAAVHGHTAERTLCSLALLYRHQHHRALSVARGYLANDEDARDAVQEAFVKAQRAAHTYDGRASLQTWLHRIVVNACLDLARHRRRRPELCVENVESAASVDVRSLGAGDPHRGVEQRELRDILETSLARLSDSHRDVLLLREVHGLDYAEIAAHEGCPPGTVMSRLFHARRHLRAQIGRRLGPTGQRVDTSTSSMKR